MRQKKEAKGKAKAEVKESTKAWISNMAPHPIELSYGGDAMIIPPKAIRQQIGNWKLLGAIPKMIQIIKEQN